MAKKGKVEREKRVVALIDKYKDKRKELKLKVKDINLSPKERMEAMWQLDALPKNSSPVRHRNRCSVTNRSRSYMRFFGLGRHTFRDMASKGLLPVSRASW